MIDPSAVEGYRRAIAARGRVVIIRRISGQAPNVGSPISVKISAIVMDYTAEAPTGETKPEGAITLGARNVIVIAADLVKARFPLPLKKNDKVVVNTDEAQLGNGAKAGDEELNIIAVDPYRREIGGAIDLVAIGT
jgi:hypothetical protein